MFDHITHTSNLSKPQVEIQEQKKQEYKKIGQIKHTPGHTLFSFNTKTKTIKRACITVYPKIGSDGKIVNVSRVHVEPYCIYREALNKKNFIKKLNKEFSNV